MVVAALLRTVTSGECCCSSRYKLITLNPFYSPKDKEARQSLRRQEWNIWLSSTADDLDLIADWWYFWVVYKGERGGFDDRLTLLLFTFCCLGSVTWLLELIQLTCAGRNFSWTWLPLLILCVEDIPQLIITLLISDRFTNMSSLGLFNIMTSLYSMMIRVAGELFMNCCYCCQKIEEDEGDGEGEAAKRYSQMHLP